MKKLALILAIASICTASQANAKDGFFVGVDVLRSEVKHKNLDRREGADTDGEKVNTHSVGFGLNAGYKISFDKIFVAPEGFYDNINSSSKDFFYSRSPLFEWDRMNVNYRYGGKVNLGYAFTPDFKGFVNAGFANVNYEYKWISEGVSYKSSKIAAIYGLGFSYDINENWLLKTSFDHQRLDARYFERKHTDRMKLDVLKVGIAYSF
jgi:hypothetical protein